MPKYLGQDPSVGRIPIASEDSVFIPLKDLIEAAEEKTAAVLWKSHYSGTPRDRRLINFLQQFPSLNQLTDKSRTDKPWEKCKGLQPWYQAGYDRAPKTYGAPKPIPGKLDDFFIETTNKNTQIILLSDDCITLREKLETVKYKGSNVPDSKRGASLKGLRRNPTLKPPMVLINKGFNRVLFSDFFVFYQDSITGISGPEKDRDLLVFLSVYAQSRLANFYQFHTSGSWGIERTEVKSHELMTLPFPTPEDLGNHNEKARLVIKEIGRKVDVFKKEIEMKHHEYNDFHDNIKLHGDSFDEFRKKKTEKLSQELDPLVYEYFGLTKEEIALIEDTCKIYEKSATPEHYSKPIKTLQKTTRDDRLQYSNWLCDTLNHWIKEAWLPHPPPFIFNSESVKFSNIGQVLISLCKTNNMQVPIELSPENDEMAAVLKRIAEISIKERGSFSYLRGLIFAEKEKIHILKPDMLGKLTRTAALNDAQTLFDFIITSPKITI